MLTNNWKDKKIFHITDTDLDGVGSRVLGEYYILPIAKEYIVENTDRSNWGDIDWRTIIENFDVVIFTDITPSLEEYNRIVSDVDVYIFDHHETAKNELGTLANYFYDIQKCGTKIFFDEIVKGSLYKRAVFQFVELVNTYDLFKTKSRLWKFAKRLNFILYGGIKWSVSNFYTSTQLYTNFVELQLQKLYSDKIFTFTYNENVLADREEAKEEKAYQEAKKSIQYRTDHSGNRYAYIELSSKISLVCKRILDEEPSLLYIVAYNLYLQNVKKEKSTKISIRSNGYDIRFIAEKYGGGGHKQASGVELPEDVFLKLRQGETHLV